MGSKNALHTLILLPAHTQSLTELSANLARTANTGDSPLLPNALSSGGVCCFLSHEHQGYMYGLHGSTKQLSTYSYMQVCVTWRSCLILANTLPCLKLTHVHC